VVHGRPTYRSGQAPGCHSQDGQEVHDWYISIGFERVSRNDILARTPQKKLSLRFPRALRDSGCLLHSSTCECRIFRINLEGKFTVIS
jgi:hypothetical protein